VLGVVRSPKRETHNGWDDPYVTVPVSFKAGPEGGLLHLNAGWLRDTAERRNLTTWGVAYEVPLASTPIVLLGEAFGENARNPSGRLGVRWTGVAKNLDLDLTVVARSGGTREERFVSLGLYYKLDPFLP
jgi:hypothetical protein